MTRPSGLVKRPGILATLAAVGVFLVGAALASATATAAPSTPWGFNEDWGFAPGSWSPDLATDHVESAAAIIPDSLSANRFHVSWRAVEWQQGTYDWSLPDYVYERMRATGDRPVMLLLSAPPWAQDPGADCPADEGVPCSYPPTPDQYDEWAEFVELAAARYPDVRAIEVYNEPNLGRFWAPAPDPEQYGEVLEVAHDAAAPSGLPVIVGGLSPTGSTTETKMSAREFTAQLYNLGYADEFEGIGVHSYPRDEPLVDDFQHDLERVRLARDSHDDPGAPLWLTEVGASSDATEGVGPARQGEVLLDAYDAIEAQDDVEAFIIHRLHETSDDTAFWNHTGVVTEDLTPKPAYCELGWAIGETACAPPFAVDDEASARVAVQRNSASSTPPGMARLARRTAKVRRGRIPVRIACAAGSDCVGTARIDSARRISLAARRRILTLARRAPVSVPAGRTAVVRMKLTRRGKRALRRSGRLRAKVTITIGSGEGTRTTIQRLRLK